MRSLPIDRQLSPRQREMMLLVLRGLRNKEIAAAMGISISTVKCQLTEAYRRLGVRNRTGAALALMDMEGAHDGDHHG